MGKKFIFVKLGFAMEHCFKTKAFQRDLPTQLQNINRILYGKRQIFSMIQTNYSGKSIQLKNNISQIHIQPENMHNVEGNNQQQIFTFAYLRNYLKRV